MIVDLIIPAYNEAPNIDALFAALGALPEGTVRHIVVADNGSTDDTAARARAHGAIVVSEPRRGYGRACLAGLSWISTLSEAPPDVVGFLDADLADDPAQLPRLLEPIRDGKASMVIGSRRRHAEPGSLNLVQRFGNWLACCLIRVLAGRSYHDLGPFRCVRWDALEQLEMEDQTWGWTVEMQMKAALLDIPWIDVDVPYRRRYAGRSKISGTLTGVTRAGGRIISTIVTLWLRRASIRGAGGAMIAPVYSDQ